MKKNTELDILIEALNKWRKDKSEYMVTKSEEIDLLENMTKIICDTEKIDDSDVSNILTLVSKYYSFKLSIDGLKHGIKGASKKSS